MQSRITDAFLLHFEANPLLVFAPGRINLIGEHTDYQEGFVFPAAITQGIYVGIAKNNLPHCRAYSLDFDQSFCFELDGLSPKKGHWATYLMGFCAQLKQAGYPLQEFDLVVGGDIPLGAGLSSSAALSVAVGLALSELFGLGLPKKNLAIYAQHAEHLFAGVKCGIMDPYASAFGKEGHALLLDCRSQSHQEIPVDLGDHTLLLVNSKVTHALAGTAYNQRRAACEESVQLLQTTYPEIQTLRDFSLHHLERIKTLLPASLFPKAKHVITECARVQEAAIALSSGNLSEVGRLLNASHASLRTDFEVSCPELDFLAEQTQAHVAVLGARMMGGGFGGCLLSLIKRSELNVVKAKLLEVYQQKFHQIPDFIEVELGEGARRS